MYTPSTRTTTTENFQSRSNPAVFARPATTRETQEMSRADSAAPRQQPAASPDDWTRECLFDCYND